MMHLPSDYLTPSTANAAEKLYKLQNENYKSKIAQCFLEAPVFSLKIAEVDNA